MNKKLMASIAVFLVLAVGAYIGLRPGKTPAKTGATSASVSGKDGGEVLPPVKADNTVVADGKVVPVHSATLSFVGSGVISSVLVKDGDNVKSGQLLAKLDSARQAAAVAQAEAQMLRAQARLEELQAGARPQEVASATASLEGAKARLARAKAGSPPLEISIAEAEVRAAQAQLDLVKAGQRPESIAAAKADVAAAKATLDQAKVALAETELRAPFAGTIAGTKVAKGEFVGTGTPIMRIMDTSAWEIDTEDLTEISVVKIAVGDPVSIEFDAIPNLKLPGKVTGINPLGESKSGDITYTVTVKPDKQDARMRWNMTATVSIKPR